MSAPLPEVTRRQLIDLARQAARRAYCPYSRFHVGAALLTDNGRFFTGANVENASYGLTLCAERTAIFAAAAAGARNVRALAVTCPDAPADSPAGYRMPCGACRQVIAEFATPGIVVSVDGVADFGLADLLPSPFTLGPATTAGVPAGEKPRLYVDIDNVLCRTDAHDAVEEMRRLAGRFDVAYLTGRNPQSQEATQQWLAGNGFPAGPILFTNRGQKHLMVAGAFALIADDPEQTEPAARAGMHAVRLAHAGDETGPNSLSHRCADWAAVSTLLCQLAGIH